MKCKICNSPAKLFEKASVLGKYPVKYFWCNNCGFMQTEKPFWLNEAYSSIITKSDIGLVGRNLQWARFTERVILTCFEPRAKFIDFGGGYGMFVRLMRDRGFDFYRQDPLCANLFAEHFDAQHGKQFALLTAWEVFEHLENPLETIEEMLQWSPFILFSTTLIPNPPPKLTEWKYYGLEHGQHIALYSSATLKYIADKFNLVTRFSKSNVHFMGRDVIDRLRINLGFGKHSAFLDPFFCKIQAHFAAASRSGNCQEKDSGSINSTRRS